MIPPEDLAGVLILLPAFFILLGATEAWARIGSPQPETTRKLIHVGGGALCAVFPFVFHSWPTVLIVTLGLAALLDVGARLRWFRSLNRVERKSRGSQYFPLAALFVYFLSGERVWLYVASILVLTLADAAAALVGERHGRIRYEVDTDSKSLEGSLAFFGLAFLAIAIPCITLADLPLVVSLLAALLVSILVTGFEAISLRGSDNLFVPIGVCVILDKITAQPPEEIVFQLVSMALIGLSVAWFVRPSRSFNTGGTIVFALFMYGAWSLGSPYWALPLFIAFAIHRIFWWIRPLPPVKSAVVLRALLIPLLALMIANSTRDNVWWFGPYLAAWTTTSSLTLWNHMLQIRLWKRSSRPVGAGAIAGLVGLTIAGIPWWIGVGIPWRSWIAVGTITLMASLLHDLFLGPSPRLNGEEAWTPLRLFLTALAALAYLALQSMRLIAPWPPL
ncbi:MAG: hypothetical protein U1E27_10625 [Kiritimatiellia bacterium]|nr:hypothetical protein [Kiritimatiellia bacterium]